MRPSAATSKTFGAVALALKLIPRDVRNDINRTTRAELNPLWRSIVASHAHTTLDSKVLAKGARVKPGNPTVLVAASSRRPLSGGLIPNESAAAFEFGTGSQNEVVGYQRKNKKSAGTHTVNRHTKRQIPRKHSGRVVYSAFAEVAPRMASLWVQIVVRRIYEAHEKR